jgi:hypothetical protein
MRRSLPLILELLLCGCPESGAPPPAPEARATSKTSVTAESVTSSASASPATTTAAVASSGPPKKNGTSLRERLVRLTKSRYMEGRCRKTTHPGWEGFPLRRCRYSVPDATGHKTTTVIMLNPSAKNLYRWIRSACDGRGDGCEDELTERILYQSSAQFPVAGIVLEDIRPTDKHFEMYCFRDGVRVEVEGFETQSTDRPTEAHYQACLSGKLIAPTSFARIAGTTPRQYRAAGGEEPVGENGAPTATWLDVTRRLYQQAWRSRDNPLLDAWVAANLARE